MQKTNKNGNVENEVIIYKCIRNGNNENNEIYKNENISKYSN